jgi:hypothetical protein
MKRITITLSNKAEKFFNEVAYSLEPTGNRPVSTQNEIVNHVFETLSDIEDKLNSEDTDFENVMKAYKFKGIMNEQVIESRSGFMDLVMKAYDKALDYPDIDDFIEEWHNNADKSTTLAEYLGLTPEEYELIIQDSSNIQIVIQKRRNKG